MMSDLCGKITIKINSTLSLSWQELQSNGLHEFPGTNSSYLRPDGFALLPWIYLVIILIVHIPTVIIRVLRWETSQLWCFATTLLTIVVFIQGYISTEFTPDKVLVWTPIILLIDAGSMSQIAFLVTDENALIFRIRLSWRDFTLWAQSKYKGRKQDFESDDVQEAERIEMINIEEGRRVDPERTEMINREEERRRVDRERHHAREREASRTLTNMVETPIYRDSSFYVATLSLILFICIVVLQVVGLKHAVDGVKGGIVPQVRWCSPIFQPFGIAVRDGDCHIYNIDQSFNKGIGCIYLPGIQQAEWLKGTIAGTSISLLLEIIDLIVLMLVSSHHKARGVKMRRPWCSMFCGLAILGSMLMFSVIYAQDLPPGITSKIWVVINSEKPFIYSGQLSSAGLRGAIIGWNDGLFSSWGKAYFGPWA